LTGLPDLEHNRLGLFWRPIIDMVDSDVAPMRLRMIAPVSDWLADPTPGQWSWFAMIGVPGLRHQVLRHAGLDQYDCREPTELPQPFRTPRWRVLTDAIDRFDTLDSQHRALLVFQLAQLSYIQFVFKLAGAVTPNGDPAHDRYAYEVARLHARYPGHHGQAVPVFERLATSSKDRLLALAACAQGISVAIRRGRSVELATSFEAHGDGIIRDGLDDEWHTWLVRSRFHRALALLRLTQRRGDDMREDLRLAAEFGDRLFTENVGGTDLTVATENKRIVVESQIKAAGRVTDSESAARVRARCQELDRMDPYCVEARLVVAEGYATVGDYAEAAWRYERAGELGTGVGAIGWFRAAQCYEVIGDRSGGLNAMGRCLELDWSAVEPREYLEKARHPVGQTP